MTLSPGQERLGTAAALAILLTVGFYATDNHMAAEAGRGRAFWRPALALDGAIPFVAQWVWIYFLYFPTCFLPLGLKALWRDLSTFRRVAFGFALQFVAASVMFWLVPSQMVRPEVHATDVSRQALAWFYQLDPGFNVFPSLHVANVSYVACLVTRFVGQASGSVVWIITGLIAISTLLVKQHYLVDLPAGVLLGIVSYRVAFVRSLGDSRARVPKGTLIEGESHRGR